MTQELLELIEAKKYFQARNLILEMNAADIAALFEELPPESAVVFFRMLPKELAADVFAYMSTDNQQRIVEGMTDKEITWILDELFLDDAVDFLEEMPASVVKRVLKNIDPKTRNLINQYLQYPEFSAGSIMTNELVDLKKNMTVADAFTRIRKTGVDKETIYTCFVVNQNRKLEGVVTAKTLLLANPDDKIEDIMDTNVIRVHTREDQEQVAKMFSKYDLLSLPVVDNEDRLVGIITIDDVVDVIQEENTEDFEKMAAITPSEDTYLNTSVLKHSRQRFSWLLFLMLSATITGIIITHYESAISVMPALVAFIPMLMDTGGNCGSQSATLVIRGLALDEIRPSDFFKILIKESEISLVVGGGLAIINMIRIWLTSHSIFLAITVSLSLYATVFISKVIGCMLPIFAGKCKIDPAVMASPLITTIVDACSILVYFNLAKVILKI